MSGRVEGVFLAQAKRTPGGKRQVLVMDQAALTALDLPAGAMKENVVVSGVPLETLPPGQRLRVGEAVFELTEACVPCQRLEAIRPGLLKASWGRRGQLAKVIAGGLVREGDAVTLLDVNPDAPRKPRPNLPD